MKTTSPNKSKEALLKAIEIAGGQQPLARILSKISGRDITQGHIFNWLKRDKKGFPPEFTIPIEKIINCQLTRSEMRPDIYPPNEYNYCSKEKERKY